VNVVDLAGVGVSHAMALVIAAEIVGKLNRQKI